MARAMSAAVLGGFHHRHQDGLHAQIEDLLDQMRLANRRAHDRMAAVADDLRLAQHRADVIGRMFAVDQQPVKARIGAKIGA